MKITSRTSIFAEKTTMDYNFDRIVRVSLYANKGKFLTEEPAIVVEYCPHDESKKLFARIDALVKYMPKVTGGDAGSSKSPGFSAVIKLYNIGASILSFINDSVTNLLKYSGDNAAANYYASKAFVKLEAGYWNHEESNRNYTEIFAGYLNSSSYYRRGVDSILDLYCHNIQIDQKKFGILQTKLRNPHTEKRTTSEIYEETQAVVLSMEQVTGTFDSVAKKIMEAYSDSRRGWLHLLKVNYRLHYIAEPENSVDPSENAKTDSTLQKFATSASDCKLTLDTDAEKSEATRVDYLTKLCNSTTSKQGTIRFKIVEHLRSYDVYFWVAQSSKKTSTTNEPTHTITDFQNFIEAPTIDGTGAFTLRMMFNPAIKPGNYVKLQWTGSIKGNAISALSKGVALNSNQAAYYSQLQAGEYQANVAGLTNTAGSVFNVNFMVAFLTHKISTHTDDWETQIKTTCAEVQGKKK